jgi:hypothetical protein
MTDGSAFGVTLRGIPLSELGPPIPGSRELSWHATPERVPGPSSGWIGRDGVDVVVGWGGWADYRVSPEGKVVARFDAVTDTEAALAFVVSVLPLTLPLFEFEPLHGSAVAAGPDAIIFPGASRAGKSTVAAALDQRGLGFITDDACSFDRTGRLWPGPAMLNSRSDDLPHPIVGEYNGKLIRSPLTSATGSFGVQAVLVLDPHEGASLEVVPTGPSEAFAKILGHARVAWFMKEQRRATQLEVVSRLAGRPTGVLRFDPLRHRVPDTADAILSWVSESISVKP